VPACIHLLVVIVSTPPLINVRLLMSEHRASPLASEMRD
jgi:hypothetical protein